MWSLLLKYIVGWNRASKPINCPYLVNNHQYPYERSKFSSDKNVPCVDQQITLDETLHYFTRSVIVDRVSGLLMVREILLYWDGLPYCSLVWGYCNLLTTNGLARESKLPTVAVWNEGIGLSYHVEYTTLTTTEQQNTHSTSSCESHATHVRHLPIWRESRAPTAQYEMESIPINTIIVVSGTLMYAPLLPESRISLSTDHLLLSPPTDDKRLRSQQIDIER